MATVVCNGQGVCRIVGASVVVKFGRAKRRILVVISVIAVPLSAVWVESPAGATTLEFGVPQVFQESGSVDSSYQTPSNTCGLLINALGGAGGSGYSGSDSGSTDYGGVGGAGGSLSILAPVSGVQTLSVSVGAGGSDGASGGSGGSGGGGSGGVSSIGVATGGGGGGESVVSILSGAILIVAGGGGGGDSEYDAPPFVADGGSGGMGANTPGSNGGNEGLDSPGGGGSLSQGGAGGSDGDASTNGADGGSNQGGDGSATIPGQEGGGGGGGYFGGGGGGQVSAGGGGSTYAIGGYSPSNVSAWTPSPTVATNGEIVLTAEECESSIFGAAPTTPTVGESYTPSATSTSGLSDTFSIDPTATSDCSMNSGVVTFIEQGTCVVDANQAGDSAWAPAPQVQQSFSISARAVPSDVISFDSDGGSSVAPVGAKNNSSITLPAAPSLAGSIFDGWFTAPTGGSKLTSPYLVAGSAILYAQWSPSVISPPVSQWPSAPVIRGRSTTKETVTITVTVLPHDRGSVILGYDCMIRGVWRHVTLSAHHQYVVRHLRPGRRFDFRLRAYNSIGVGNSSHAISVVTL
jgi:List-Bact-rpt repeat protein/glycine rich protein